MFLLQQTDETPVKGAHRGRLDIAFEQYVQNLLTALIMGIDGQRSMAVKTRFPGGVRPHDPHALVHDHAPVRR